MSDLPSTSNVNTLVQIFDKLIAGAIAGVAGTVVIFPIDSIKTRLQSGNINFSGPFKGLVCAKDVVLKEGVRGLYRGLSANLLGVTPEKAIKLAVNDVCRAHFAKTLSTTPDILPPVYGMLCGATAGFCQVIATNPMEIVKIQMQLASLSPTREISNKPSLFKVVRSLGLRGLYRGSLSTLFRDIPFSIMFFQSFAALRHLLRNPSDPSPQLAMTLLAGMLAGGASAVVATPMDVVKTRLQSPASKAGTSMLDVYRQVIAESGVKGLFRGSTQRCLIVAPLFSVSLLVYEAQQHYIKKLYMYTMRKVPR